MFARALLIGSLAIGIHAQSSSTSASPISAQTTLALFVDAVGNDFGYVGSIVAADSCETTIALQCTAGDSTGEGLLVASCDPSATALATYGPGRFEVKTKASSDGVVASIAESCSLGGTTEAVCAASVSFSAEGTATSSTTTTTKSGSDVQIFQVPITAGASKISGASCTGGATGAGTGTHNAAAPTGAVHVVKVLVVPGAVALLAGIHAMA